MARLLNGAIVVRLPSKPNARSSFRRSPFNACVGLPASAFAEMKPLPAYPMRWVTLEIPKIVGTIRGQGAADLFRGLVP